MPLRHLKDSREEKSVGSMQAIHHGPHSPETWGVVTHRFERRCLSPKSPHLFAQRFMVRLSVVMEGKDLHTMAQPCPSPTCKFSLLIALPLAWDFSRAAILAHPKEKASWLLPRLKRHDFRGLCSGQACWVLWAWSGCSPPLPSFPIGFSSMELSEVVSNAILSAYNGSLLNVSLGSPPSDSAPCGAPPPMTSNDALLFHEKCGTLIKLSNNNKTAERRRPLDEFNNGVVMTNRPLRDNERFEVGTNSSPRWCV